MSDAIFITGLLIHAHHGVMPHEEKVGQRFVIDLELAIDLAQAAADAFSDAVNGLRTRTISATGRTSTTRPRPSTGSQKCSICPSTTCAPRRRR